MLPNSPSCCFFGFFIALVFYLNKESRREGYPLEDEQTGKIHPGSLFDGDKKVFKLPHGRGTYVPPKMSRATISTSPACRASGPPVHHGCRPAIR